MQGRPSPHAVELVCEGGHEHIVGKLQVQAILGTSCWQCGRRIERSMPKPPARRYRPWEKNRGDEDLTGYSVNCISKHHKRCVERKQAATCSCWCHN